MCLLNFIKWKKVVLNCMRVYKIQKNYDFRTVYSRGKVFSNKLFVLYIYRNKKNIEFNRLGISISKRVGKSVIRNKIRRRIYEVYRLNLHNLKQGYDIVFIARVGLNDKAYLEFERGMFNLLKKSSIMLQR